MVFRINCVTGRVLCRVIFFLLNFPGSCALHAGTVFNRPSATVAADGLEAVDVSYQKDFPYVSNYNNQHLPECTEAFVFSGNKKSRVLRCLERIQLLRPAPLVEQWEDIQKENGYFPLTVKALGIVGVHAHIKKAINTLNVDLSSVAAGTVTGVFLRHVLSIRKYTFKNKQTGARSMLVATPEHPFFAINSRDFMPVSMLSSHHQLLTDTNQKMQILCPVDRINHCGKPINPIGPARVYNMELHQKHIYFVGAAHIMVHNVCKLTYQEVYQYFNGHQRIREQEVKQKGLPQFDPDRSVLYRRVKLKTFHITYCERDLDILESMNAGRLDEGMESTFDLGRTLRYMGFTLSGEEWINGKVLGVWTMKYPLSKKIYEKNVLSAITSLSLDRIIKGYTGQDVPGYAGLRHFIARVAPASIEKYPYINPNHPLTGRSMLINSFIEDTEEGTFTRAELHNERLFID